MASKRNPPSEEQRIHNQKRSLIKRILNNYHHWRAACEDHGVRTLTIEGREWNLMDVLDGMEKLPQRQREAVMLVCVEGYSQSDAALIMGFKNRSTPVQQYVSLGLDKLVKHHDEVYRKEREHEAKEGC